MCTLVLSMLLAGVSFAPAGAVAETATPAFVQQVSAKKANVPQAGLGLTPAANLTAANRLIVMAHIRSSSGAKANSVIDSSGNTYVNLLRHVAPNGAELSVWTAPLSRGGGTRPTITIKPTSKATVGAAALEYAGLTPVADASILDQFATASGTTSAPQTVASGATAALTAENDLILGLYADTGSATALTADPGYTERVNVSPNNVSQLLAEDRILDSGATPNATARAGGTTTWQMTTVALKAASIEPPGAPGAPTFVTAAAGDGSATVSWTAPPDNGSAITSYTVTPYIGTSAQTPKIVTGSPPATGTTITGLTNGSAYTFKVSATNAVGTGPASTASNTVTPNGAGEPGAPGGVSARAATSSAQVSWNAPASDGGSAITSYTVTPYIGTTAQTPKTVTGSPPATTTTISGLTNGTAYTFKVSATNAVGTSPASTASNEVTPQNTIFDFAVPGTIDGGDTSPVELGVKFRADVGGTVTGVRFYKSAANTGTHSASLWTAGGQRLAQITFTAETASGWQTATFSTPVAISAGTTYIASYFAPNGHYSATVGGLSSAVDNAPLHALGNSTSANGVYSYAPAPTFPTSTFNAANYWVDVTFAPGAPSAPTAPTNVSATAGDGSASVSWTAPVSDGGGPITSYTITPYIGDAAQTPKTVTGSPPATTTTISGLTNGTAYTFKVTAINAVGTGPASTASNSVTPTAPSEPAAPTNVGATPGNGYATVSWTAPASDGGSPITSYTVTPYIGTSAQTPKTVTGSPPATTTTISGLTNDTAYTFKVTATNAVGTSPESAASDPVIPGPNSIGQWGEPMDWPIVAMTSVVLRTGELLVWDGWENPQPTSLWNLNTQAFRTFLPHFSIFCSGQAQMPGGRILVAGGHGIHTTGELGIADATVFDPATSTWTRIADMNHPRWYPALTELADGRYVAISGNSTNASTWADTPEVYDPAANTWTELSGISTSQIHEEEYPFTYLTPTGKVFTIGPSEDVSFFLDVDDNDWSQTGGPSGIMNGSSVMYRPGKVLYSGGAASLNSVNPARQTTAVIDLNASTPNWRTTAPMNDARVYHSLTMLADGRVFGVGGQPASGDPGNINVGVQPTEIWDPATETWSPAAPLSLPRGYHSTSVLLPDGRVLVAGGGHAVWRTVPGQFSAEIYSPPYMFKASRPTITQIPSSAEHGSTISIDSPNAASIRSVNLVSLAATTHQLDMSQHFVPLSFTARAGGLDVEIPANAALAPPADYMVFIVDDRGTPSVASFVSIVPSTTVPGVSSSISATAKDSSATVTWSKPPDGGSPITSYTVTPYVGSEPQTAKTVTGAPPARSTTFTGLTNGTTYTFKVSAANELGSGPQSAASNAVTPRPVTVPTFVQQASAQQLVVGTAGLSVTPASSVTTGNRLIVQTEMWSHSNSTAASVTDSAGNVYTKLLSFTGPEGTEMSVWTAPITSGGGTRPTVTVKPTSQTGMGFAVLEYAGLSQVPNASVVDRLRTASGTTGSTADTVSSGPTAELTTDNALVLGLYADSGFGVTLTPDAAYTQRVNTSPSDISDLLVEDRLLSTGATPNATVSTGARTTWLMATLALKASQGT